MCLDPVMLMVHETTKSSLRNFPEVCFRGEIRFQTSMIIKKRSVFILRLCNDNIIKLPAQYEISHPETDKRHTALWLKLFSALERREQGHERSGTDPGRREEHGSTRAPSALACSRLAGVNAHSPVN